MSSESKEDLFCQTVSGCLTHPDKSMVTNNLRRQTPEAQVDASSIADICSLSSSRGPCAKHASLKVLWWTLLKVLISAKEVGPQT